MRLAWGASVSLGFRAKLLEVCNELGWTSEQHPSWLMSCMAFESGETFSPSIKNAAGSGATGLIQFMPATAKGLGTSVEALSKMTAVQQLEFVRIYFEPYKRRVNSLSDMYMAILLPKFVGKPDESVLFLDPSVSYRQNSGLDANKDGKVTKLEATSKVAEKYKKGMREPFVFDMPS